MISIIVAIYCQTSFAAKILLKDNNQFPSGDIIGIQDRVVVVKTEFGNLTAEFDKIDTILFDEKASPTKPGIQFKNGDIITGELDSLKENVLTIKMPYGIYVIQDRNEIASVNFAKSKDQFDYDQESSLKGLFSLNKDEHIYGNLLAIEDGLIVVNSRYGTLNIRLDEIEKVEFADKPKMSNPKSQMIILRNNDRIQGTPISFKNGEFHIQTGSGEMIITKANVLASIIFGENTRITSIKNTSNPQSEEINFDFAKYKEWDIVPEFGKENVIVKTKRGLALSSANQNDSSAKPILATIQGFSFTAPFEIVMRIKLSCFLGEKYISLFDEDDQNSIRINFKDGNVIFGSTDRYRGDFNAPDVFKIVVLNGVVQFFINDEFWGSQEISFDSIAKIAITMKNVDYLYSFSIKPIEQ